jgi:hypothetical protein
MVGPPRTAAGIWAEWPPAAASRDGALCGRSGFPRGGRTAGLALPPCVCLLLLCSLRRCASSCCALCVGVPVPVLVPVPAPVSVRLSYTYVHLYLCRSTCVALPMYIYLYLYTCIYADVSVSTHLLCASTHVSVHLYLLPFTCVYVPPPVAPLLSLTRYLF